MTKNLLSKDLFVIEVGEEFDKPNNSINILYSPFTDNALMVTPDYVQQMEMYIEDKEKDYPQDLRETMDTLLDEANRKKCAPLAKSPEEYSRMAILPNNVCNFRCSYCYSAQGRSNKIISKDVLKSTLDYFIDPARVPVEKKLAISILGGGEPLLSWDLVKFCIEYSNQRANAFGYPGVDCNVVTNGSVFTQDIIDTLKKYKVPVSVSFEILEDIQNLQRGNYKKVAENIDWIISEGIRPQLRATITDKNIMLMKRMIEEVLQRFPGTREVMMEYVTDSELLTTPESVREFYKQYTDNFFEAHDYAAQHGLLLDCSAYRNFNLLIERFCPGDNTITPDGEISVCSRIGAPQDLGYQDSIYGKISADGTVDIDRSKFDRLIRLNVHHYPKCKTCFAKWHCAGGCMIHKYTYGEDIQNEICEYTRNFTRRMLLRNIDKEYISHYSISLKEAISQM